MLDPTPVNPRTGLADDRPDRPMGGGTILEEHIHQFDAMRSMCLQMEWMESAALRAAAAAAVKPFQQKSVPFEVNINALSALPMAATVLLHVEALREALRVARLETEWQDDWDAAFFGRHSKAVERLCAQIDATRAATGAGVILRDDLLELLRRLPKDKIPGNYIGRFTERAPLHVACLVAMHTHVEQLRQIAECTPKPLAEFRAYLKVFRGWDLIAPLTDAIPYARGAVRSMAGALGLFVHLQLHGGYFDTKHLPSDVTKRQTIQQRLWDCMCEDYGPNATVFCDECQRVVRLTIFSLLGPSLTAQLDTMRPEKTMCAVCLEINVEMAPSICQRVPAPCRSVCCTECFVRHSAVRKRCLICRE